MKLFVHENQNLAETEVEIRCKERTSEVENLICAINSAANVIIGEKESGDKTRVYLTKILYFEAVDRNVYAYTESDIYKVRKTMYDIEDMVSNEHFARISKSVIVNIRAVRRVSPDSARRLKLQLSSAEWVVVSRNYVEDFKQSIGMKGNS
nr:LytTR family DNA-binding domain-containing protein [uncultured Butyrivibrio sp.]